MGPPLQRWAVLHDALNYSTAVFWLLAYGAVLQKVQRERSACGVSFQTLFALVVVEVSNVLLILSLLAFHGKPFHLDFFLVDCTSAAVSIWAFVHLFRNFRTSYEQQRDSFGLKYLRLLRLRCCCAAGHLCCLYLLSFLLSFSMFLLRRSPHAALARSSSSSSSSSSRVALGLLLSLWECFNDSVLALALLPQLQMFYSKRPRKVSHLLGTFVAMLFCARVLAFLYWLSFPLFHRSEPTGRGIHLATEALNILILLDFLYYYVKAKLAGQEDIALPI
ncbi:hypothetical protein, conserved [Eimeria necatrix]|uniref:ER lumen protein retaining receptor n=1 Tax=Eimeria necatrix TaxID=51315 RepID=U6N059_9EIME|nr:hypothetical protein, conserved [Eimeria necatrix]CDJ69582.1 hypothetical protein, conserved [Eimeria necatrix]